MPLSDPETLTAATSNPGITCESLHNDDRVEEHPDYPAESCGLSKDAELDWFDRNAFFDRKDSTKATNYHTISSSNPQSQRFSVTKKSKTSIIGLPKPRLVDPGHRRKQTNSRLFPSAAQPVAEPSSPKVSCMGRVRSRRDRNRRMKNRQRSLKSALSEKPMATPRRKKSLWKSLSSIFTGHKPEPDSDPKTSRATLSPDGSAVNVSALGWMTRFSSGRRSGGWVGDVAEIRSLALHAPLARFSSGRRSDGWAGDVGEIYSEPLDQILTAVSSSIKPAICTGSIKG